jgi:hypothetical protein
LHLAPLLLPLLPLPILLPLPLPPLARLFMQEIPWKK